LVRVIRRRLGLTQRELAYLIGYDSDSQLSRIENGSRHPRLTEMLLLELVLGLPAVMLFPQIRQSIAREICVRAEALLASTQSTSTAASPRVLYKNAQLERLLASMRIQDDLDQGITN
jgi:transcriptional regulator with XRE-family HTH domain